MAANRAQANEWLRTLGEKPYGRYCHYLSTSWQSFDGLRFGEGDRIVVLPGFDAVPHSLQALNTVKRINAKCRPPIEIEVIQ